MSTGIHCDACRAFPSPLGEQGISTLEVFAGVMLIAAFPSPLGEQGISTGRHPRVRDHAAVSVPSRGTGNINYTYRCIENIDIITNSFRPLSGNREYQQDTSTRAPGSLLVSVPSRGTGNINAMDKSRIL